MPKIDSITCHRIVNSRGDWTIQTKVRLDDGSEGVQAIPEGASKGENEAVCLPVDKAVEMVAVILNDALKGEDALNQEKLDNIMIEMDGTENKNHLGGNSILSVSLATAHAAANSQHLELYQYLSVLYSGKELAKGKIKFPTPVFNILNGGKHARNHLSFQEFMVIPSPSMRFDKTLEVGINVYHDLKKQLTSDGHATAVGDEGGFAPFGLNPEKALAYVRNAASNRYKVGSEVFLGMDVAAGSFFKEDLYDLHEENLQLTNEDLSKYYEKLLNKFEIMYLEDPFYEKDFLGWKRFSDKNKKRVMVVGDDLVVTNYKLLKGVLLDNLITGVIVKPNQIGTLTETFKFIKEAQDAGLSIIVSHRSGETAEDTFIADLSLSVGAEFIKSGAPVRGERVVKYNRLLNVFMDESYQSLTK